MFQKSMSIGIGEQLDRNLIVDLLSNNFKSMQNLGDTTLKPFLQDVVQFVPLCKVRIHLHTVTQYHMIPFLHIRQTPSTLSHAY